MNTKVKIFKLSQKAAWIEIKLNQFLKLQEEEEDLGAEVEIMKEKNILTVIR